MKELSIQKEQVTLYYDPYEHDIRPQHVLIIAKYHGKWLLTKHRTRGIEFPGGKVEANEGLKEAAIREVYEETGATIKDLSYVGEYVVDAQPPFCKVVYTGQVVEIEEQHSFMETSATLLWTTEEFVTSMQLSFHMKDEGILLLMQRVEQYE